MSKQPWESVCSPNPGSTHEASYWNMELLWSWKTLLGSWERACENAKKLGPRLLEYVQLMIYKDLCQNACYQHAVVSFTDYATKTALCPGMTNYSKTDEMNVKTQWFQWDNTGSVWNFKRFYNSASRLNIWIIKVFINNYIIMYNYLTEHTNVYGIRLHYNAGLTSGRLPDGPGPAWKTFGTADRSVMSWLGQCCIVTKVCLFYCVFKVI